MLLINDTHLGARRSAGTTKESQKALQFYTESQFTALLKLADKSLCILGDLFDAEEIDADTLLFTYTSLHSWLAEDKDRKLILVAGNHDLSKDSAAFSSFELLSELLTFSSPEQVNVVQGVGMRLDVDNTKLHIIPHMPNQTLFDAELEKVEDVDFLLLHANCASPFAQHSDHSLNVSIDQLAALRAKHITPVFAHEHQGRNFMYAVCLGNQFPTSVSDCLNNREKYAHRIKDGEIFPILSWEASNSFVEVRWDEITDETEGEFIRVHGSCTYEEFPAAVKKAVELRNRSKAFVVSNAIEVQQEGLAEVSISSLEEARAFDVMSYLKEVLSAEQYEAVERCLK